MILDENTILEKVTRIITENASDGSSMDNLGKEFEFKNLNINSISFVKIIVFIENEFGIEFNDEDLDHKRFPDIDSLVLYIKDKLLIQE